MASTSYRYMVQVDKLSDIYRKVCVWPIDENDNTMCCGAKLYSEMNSMYYCKEHCIAHFRNALEEDHKDAELMKSYYDAQFVEKR